MVLKKYLWSLKLRVGAAVIGIICFLYYGAMGGFVAFRFFGDGPQYGLATLDSILNYGQLGAYALLFVSGILLASGAFLDCPKMALMFLICGGVYTVWCLYMIYYLVEFTYKIGWKLEAGYNILLEFLFMSYSWVAILSYIMDEENMF